MKKPFDCSISKGLFQAIVALGFPPKSLGFLVVFIFFFNPSFHFPMTGTDNSALW